MRIKNIMKVLTMPFVYTICNFLIFVIVFNVVFAAGIDNAVFAINAFEISAPIILFIFLWRKYKDYIIPDKLDGKKCIKFLLIGGALNFIFIGIIYILNRYIGNTDFVVKIISNYKASMNLSETYLETFLISSCLFTPIVEEILFRYCGTKYLSGFDNKIIILLTSLSFGLIHLNFLHIIYTFVLGMILEIIYLKYKNLYYTIFLHLGFNICGILLYFI